jgi:hypothetical protein
MVPFLGSSTGRRLVMRFGRGLGVFLLAALAFSLLAGAAGAASPAAVTGDHSNLSTSSVRLNGSVDPNGEATTWYFEFGPTTAYGTKTATQNAGSGNNPTNVSINLSGLSPATSYHYRLVASNASGTTLGADRSFMTQGPPAVALAATQNAVGSSATLHGTVDPHARSTTWWFEWGTTTGYGTRSSSKNAGSGNGSVPVSVTITNLNPGTTYHFRLVARNSAGTVSSSDGTFATVPAVTLTQTIFRVVAGRYIRLSGTVAGAQPGQSVTVLAQPFGAGAFTQVATVLTGGGGTWSFLAQPRVATTYAASANGSTSTSVTIGVQPAMTLRRITKARFSTRVTGATSFVGKFVKFQRLVGDRWVTVKQTRLNASSVAIFPASLLPKGRSTIRVAISVNQAGPGYLGGKSRTLTYTRS